MREFAGDVEMSEGGSGGGGGGGAGIAAAAVPLEERIISQVAETSDIDETQVSGRGS